MHEIVPSVESLQAENAALEEENEGLRDIVTFCLALLLRHEPLAVLTEDELLDAQRYVLNAEVVNGVAHLAVALPGDIGS